MIWYISMGARLEYRYPNNIKQSIMISTQSNSTPVTTKPKNPTMAPACSVNAPSPSPPPAAGPPAPLLCADGLAEVVGVCVVCALEVVEPVEVSGDEPGPPEM